MKSICRNILLCLTCLCWLVTAMIAEDSIPYGNDTSYSATFKTERQLPLDDNGSHFELHADTPALPAQVQRQRSQSAELTVRILNSLVHYSVFSHNAQYLKTTTVMLLLTRLQSHPLRLSAEDIAFPFNAFW